MGMFPVKGCLHSQTLSHYLNFGQSRKTRCRSVWAYSQQEAGGILQMSAMSIPPPDKYVVLHTFQILWFCCKVLIHDGYLQLQQLRMIFIFTLCLL